MLDKGGNTDRSFDFQNTCQHQKPPLNLPLGKIIHLFEAVLGISIVHLNPPVEIRVGYESKYLKIGHIALLLTH